MNNLNEKQTRESYIDKQLQDAGWDVSDKSQVIQEYTIESPQNTILEKKRTTRLGQVAEPEPIYNRQLRCDYVLLGGGGKILAVVEVKRIEADPHIAQEQIKEYALAIQNSERKQQNQFLPFCFYTNGSKMYFWDIDDAHPREVYQLPSLQDLERLANLRINRINKTILPVTKNSIIDRQYQLEAVCAVLDGIKQNRRKFLLVMATGTGKTRTLIGLVRALLDAGRVQRILFLADRNSLVEQANDAFTEHLSEESRWSSIDNKVWETTQRVYTSTLQSMLGSLQKISPYFFDLVVVDECHRSVYNEYSRIIQHFDALCVGLTATPTNYIDRDTFKLFGCESEMPTYAFTYQQAMEAGYLCPFITYVIRTKFQEEGINDRTVSLEDQEKSARQGQDDSITNMDYKEHQFEHIVSNDDTNRLLIQTLMKVGITGDDGRIGKTIIYCINQGHAQRMKELIDELYPEYKGNLAKVIISDIGTNIASNLIASFKRESMPRIALNVGMLDTGVDVPEVVNLVLARRIYSYVKFWQIVGRGTRYLSASAPREWCMRKDKFLILDAWDNIAYFKLNPLGNVPQSSIPVQVRWIGLHISKLEWAYLSDNQAVKTYQIGILEQAIRQLVAQENIDVKNNQDILKRALNQSFWDNIDEEKIEFLRVQIKPLFRTFANYAPKQLRFDSDIVAYSLAASLQQDKDAAELLAIIQKQIQELPLQLSQIKAHQSLIQQSQHNSFWQNIQHEKLNQLSAQLAPLMEYRQAGNHQQLQRLDFEDSLMQDGFVTFGSEHSLMSVDAYREVLELQLMQAVDSNDYLKRIKQGESLSDIEIFALAEQLQLLDPRITEAHLRKLYKHKTAKLWRLLRHILKIEILPNFVDEITNAINQLANDIVLETPLQYEFMRILRDFLIEKGTVTRDDWKTAAFSNLSPYGIVGIFGKDNASKIKNYIAKIVA